MRWSCTGWLVTLAVAAGAVAHGAATMPATRPATQAAAEVQRLIEQLSADDWQSRQAAQDQLVSLADDAVPALERLLRQSSDTEVRNRAETALGQIAENRVIGPTFITLHHKLARPKVVFADLAKQARIAWATDPPDMWSDDDAGSITLDADRQPLCAVLREFCLKARVRPVPSADPGKLVLSSTADGDDALEGVASVSGPFVVIAQQIVLNKTVKLNQAQTVQHDFTMEFFVLAEPKLRILAYSPTMTVEEAEDEKGNKLLPADPTDNDLANPGGPQGFVWNPGAQLQYPANAGKRIAKFRGSLGCVLQTRGDAFLVSDVLKAAGFTRETAGARFTVKKVKANGREYEVDLSVARQTLEDGPWQRIVGLVTSGQARLLDSKGQSLIPHGVNNNSDREDRLDVTMLFTRPEDGVGEPSKLVIDVPVEVKEVKIPVELKDLPMP